VIPTKHIMTNPKAFLIIAFLAALIAFNWWWLPQKWHACQRLYDNKPAQVMCLLMCMMSFIM